MHRPFLRPAHHEDRACPRTEFGERRLQRLLQVDDAAALFLSRRDRRMHLVGQRHHHQPATAAIGDQIGGDAEQIGLRLLERPLLCGGDQPRACLLHQILGLVRIGDAPRDERPQRGTIGAKRVGHDRRALPIAGWRHPVVRILLHVRASPLPSMTRVRADREPRDVKM